MSLWLIFGLTVWLVAVMVLLVSSIHLRQHLKPNQQAPTSNAWQEPITILKPLKGLDFALSENLESFFNLDYPDYELIFSVAQEDDQAISCVKHLLKKYPRVDARLLIGAVNIGANPKINNLMHSFSLAKHDLILISDSNTRVGNDFLTKNSPSRNEGLGVSSAIVVGTEAEGWGGKLEALYLNTFFARGLVLANRHDAGCVLGKAMIFRKSQSLRFGGLKQLSPYIAEDYMMGQVMKQLDLPVRVLAQPVQQIIGQYSLKDFWNRHIRWGRIRKSQVKTAFYAELFLSCLFSGIIGSIALQGLLGLNFLSLLLIHLGFWFAVDAYCYQKLLPQTKITQIIPAWILKELFAIPLWLHTVIGNQVLWRGKWMTLRTGGLVVESELSDKVVIKEKAIAGCPEGQYARIFVGGRYQ